MRRRSHQPQRIRVLDRLPTLIAVPLAIGLAGCQEEAPEPPTAPKSRSAAVAAKSDPGAGKKPSEPKASAEPVADRPPLCEGQLDQPGKALPDSEISRHGTPQPPEAIPAGQGKWTWLNFWAAWCVPCREEIPRLRAWEKKSGDKMRLVFVSLDDDERQLERFLAEQPPGGVKSTYWLRDGGEREAWLGELGIEGDPELPMHLLLGPEGKVRCTISGAVEDGDYARVSEIVSG